MGYSKIECRSFEEIGNGGELVYFSHTENFIITSIPKWNWSYMWNLEIKDDKQMIEECTKALSVPMFSDDAKKLTERIYRHLMGRNY